MARTTNSHKPHLNYSVLETLAKLHSCQLQASEWSQRRWPQRKASSTEAARKKKCSGFVRWQWDWKSARPVRTRNKHSEICFSLAFESSCRPTGNCLSKSKGVCCWDCGRQATMRGARQPHVAVSRPIQMQFISPPSNSRVNFTCAKMCLPSDRFLVKSPEEWHKYVPSCHENAAEQPLCRLLRRQLPHSCTFLYLHILWQCDHQPTSAQHLIADTTDRRTRLRLSFVLVDAFGIN